MKIIVNEWDSTFNFALEPETVAEASLLVRLKMNGKPRTCAVYTYATKSGIRTDVYIDKVKSSVEHVRSGREA